LTLAAHLLRSRGLANQSQYILSERADKQQHVNSLFFLAATGGESQTQTLIFQITELFFDLRALGIHGGDRFCAQFQQSPS
jgi:hypothetical protein